MRAKKDRLLPASQVPIVFSNKRVREITARLRPPLDEGQVRRFAASLRKTARVYLRAKQAQKDDISHAIKALYRTADMHQYKKAAKLVQDLSKQTRDFLNKRATRIGLKLPRPVFFLDRARRKSACETVRRLCSEGGHKGKGKWVPHLYLPKRQFMYEEDVQAIVCHWVKVANKHGVKVDMRELRRKVVKDLTGVDLPLRSPKRQAERDFIMFLQVDYLNAINATGRRPPVTARKYEQSDQTLKPSPFVQMVQKCFELLGAEVDVIEQINQLQSRRSAQKKKLHRSALIKKLQSRQRGRRKKSAVTSKMAKTRKKRALLKSKFSPKP
jgi:hypothetical protein